MTSSEPETLCLALIDPTQLEFCSTPILKLAATSPSDGDDDEAELGALLGDGSPAHGHAGVRRAGHTEER